MGARAPSGMRKSSAGRRNWLAGGRCVSLETAHAHSESGGELAGRRFVLVTLGEVAAKGGKLHQSNFPSAAGRLAKVVCIATRLDTPMVAMQ